jgi:hypothetical protein
MSISHGRLSPASLHISSERDERGPQRESACQLGVDFKFPAFADVAAARTRRAGPVAVHRVQPAPHSMGTRRCKVVLVFGMGMGMGRGNSSLRAVRLGLLVMVILAGVVFHHTGGVYDTIHVLYLVLIVGLLGFALMTRRRRQSPGGTAGGSWGGTSGGSWGATPSAPSTDRPNDPRSDSSTN